MAAGRITRTGATKRSRDPQPRRKPWCEARKLPFATLIALLGLGASFAMPGSRPDQGSESARPQLRGESFSASTSAAEESKTATLSAERIPAAESALPKKAHSNERTQRDRFENDRVLTVQQRELEGGRLERLKVIRMREDVHYPLVRVRETHAPDPATGDLRLVRQDAMVADHLLVQLRPGIRPERMIAIARALKATVREHAAASNFFLIAFDGADPNAMERIGERLRNNPEISAVSPDYLTWVGD